VGARPIAFGTKVMKIHTKSRTYTLLASLVFFNSIGNVLLSKGMKEVGRIDSYSPSALGLILFKVFTTGAVWLGIASLLAFFVSYLLLLSWADFSYVQPVSAIGYAVVAVLSYFLLGEILSWTRWSGVLLICAGVGLVGGTESAVGGD
jgi:drug/metabolite transporter (DMT)-like permease